MYLHSFSAQHSFWHYSLKWWSMLNFHLLSIVKTKAYRYVGSVYSNYFRLVINLPLSFNINVICYMDRFLRFDVIRLICFYVFYSFRLYAASGSSHNINNVGLMWNINGDKCTWKGSSGPNGCPFTCTYWFVMVLHSISGPIWHSNGYCCR